MAPPGILLFQKEGQMRCKRSSIKSKDSSTSSELSADSANDVRWRSAHLKNRTRASRETTSYSRMTRLAHGGYIIKIFDIVPYLSLILFLLLSFTILNPAINNNVYATDEPTSTIETKGDATASITLDTSNIQVNAAPGTTAYATKNITINANNVESYTLTITAPQNLTNTIKNNNGGSSSDNNDNTITYTNPWSYTYGNQEDLDTTEKLEAIEDYKAFTGSAQELESGTGTNITITNSNKTIVFSSYFADGTVSGRYTADVTLSLTSTPNSVAKDLSGITYMQEMTPEICENTPFMSEDVTYSKEYILTDKRTYPKDADGNSISNTYTVRKIGDQCWMTQNLRIYDATLTPEDSDIESGEFDLTATTGKNLFNDNDTGKYTTLVYRGTTSDPIPDAGLTTYYNWFAATAGAGNANVTTKNQNVNASICPKGWTLPTGGTTSAAATESTWTDFYRLFRNMDLGISISSLSTDTSTSWSSKNGISDLDVVQTEKDANGKVIYNFLYTGYIHFGSLVNGASYGYWWSSTAIGASSAYYLIIYSDYVFPGTNSQVRYIGLPVRCIARGNAEWRMSDATAVGYSTASTLKDSGISTMQEMTAEVCDQVETPASTAKTVPTLRLRDTRDDNDYIIAKYPDGRCWMAENLRIYNTTIKAADSDFEGDDIVLPNSTLADFTSDDTSKYSYQSYFNADQTTSAGVNTTSYYNWYTATAGAGDDSVNIDNASVDASICPKGWTLPTGGLDRSISEFGKFTTAITIGNTTAGSNKIRATPYGFKYTGYVFGGSLTGGGYDGYWWSSTASDTNSAYSLRVLGSGVSFGTGDVGQSVGLAVRCIARN